MAANDKGQKKGFFRRIARWFRELRSETKKITWPSFKQVKNNTGAVLVIALVSGVVIWGLDFLFANIVRLVFKS